MPKTNTSVQSVKNSNGNAPAFDKLTKAELIELLSGDIKNPMKDFAKKICKVETLSYLCNARMMHCIDNNVHTKREISVAPGLLLLMQLYRSRKTQGGNASFCTYLLNF